MNAPAPLDVVCVLHGGFPLPEWLVASGHRLHVTLNDPADHPYPGLPEEAVVTRNSEPHGFAENVNAALRRLFRHPECRLACLVNFDTEAPEGALAGLASALAADPQVGVAGAALRGADGAPTFSVGTMPTPAKEALRAAGLRGESALRLQRALLRRTRGWAARNAQPGSGARILDGGEYLPMTFVVIRRRAWESVGELDERFPLYGEDIDWSLRCDLAGWRLALVECGPVVHFERATRGPRSDALYEYSQLELHRKWGWTANLKWQRRALAARRCWPLRQLTVPLDWGLLKDVSRSVGPLGPSVSRSAGLPDQNGAGASDRLATALAAEWLQGRATSVTWLNHHSALQLHQAPDDGGMAALRRIGYVGIDGLLLLRLMGVDQGERTSADLVVPRLLPLLKGARIALVGATRPSLERAAQIVADELAAPGATVVDARDGYSGLPTTDDIGPWLRSCEPNVVLVGLGAPLQERWAAEVAARIPSGLVVTCGGFFDQVHHRRYYPGWAYGLRLNWAVRLARDPIRLWRRYSIEALHALRDRHALRREIECLAGFRTYRAVVTGRPPAGR